MEPKPPPDASSAKTVFHYVAQKETRHWFWVTTQILLIVNYLQLSLVVSKLKQFFVRALRYRLFFNAESANGGLHFAGLALAWL